MKLDRIAAKPKFADDYVRRSNKTSSVVIFRTTR